MLIRRSVVISLLLLLLAPAMAIGCSLVAAPPARPHIAVKDLRFLHRHEASRAAWVKDDRWESSRVFLQNTIQPSFLRRPVTAAYAQQSSVALMAIRQADGEYGDDADPATTTCALAGKRVYSDTHLLVHETSWAVLITLVSKRTEGSTAGCRVFSTSCDDLVQRTVQLKAPIGARQLYAVTFA